MEKLLNMNETEKKKPKLNELFIIFVISMIINMNDGDKLCAFGI